MLAEPSGALALAAAQKVAPAQKGKSICLVTGGSISFELMLEILKENP